MEWVLGFLFNENLNQVLLLRKKRGPKFNIGKLNGIGGKIEEFETPIDAMEREAFEEAGLKNINWSQFCSLKTKGGDIHIMTASTDKIYNFEQLEDEPLGIFNIADLDNEIVVTNLYWLIPMAYNHIKKIDSAPGFVIQETY